MRPTLTARRLEQTAPLILIIWVVLNYGWTIGFGFMNDDYIWIDGARWPVGGASLRTAFVPPVWSGNFVRPLVQLSFVLNYLVNGIAPIGYHIVNLLLQVANTYLVWRLARVLAVDTAAAVFVGMLFAVQPTHAEVVTWISGRTELIAATFYLIAVLLHIRGRTWWAAGMFALALLAKESAASFPLMIVAIDLLIPRAGRWRPAPLFLYATVFGAYILLRHFVTQSFAQGYIEMNTVLGSPGELIRLLAIRLVQALRALLAPLPVSGPPAAVIVLALVGLSLWATDGGPARRVVGLASLWVPVAMAPFFGFFMFQTRYVYLASVGWTLLLATGGRALVARLVAPRWSRPAAGATAALWILACVLSLQLHNEQLRRNGVMSDQVVNALVAAVPQPVAQTLFLVGGLEALRGGSAEWNKNPVLLFGLPEALRLRFNDPTVDVRFAEVASAAPADQGRPVVRLQWDAANRTFLR